MSPAVRTTCAVVFTMLVAGTASGQPPDSFAGQSESHIGISFQSTLQEYQPFAEEKLGSWREANDNVGRIGGWREYAREGRQPEGGAPATTPSPRSGEAPPARDPHAGHGQR